MSPAHAKRTGILRLPAGIARDLSGSIYALEVADNSLAPRFCKGDSVIADPNLPTKPGDHVVLWPAEAQGTPTLHRLAAPGEGADKAGPGVTIHKITGRWRPEE